MADIHNNLDLMDECISKMRELSDSIQDTTTFIFVALDNSDSYLSGRRQEINREVISDGYRRLSDTKEALDSGRRDLERLKDCLQIYLSLKFQR